LTPARDALTGRAQTETWLLSLRARALAAPLRREGAPLLLLCGGRAGGKV
jgi:hypothetical protein